MVWWCHWSCCDDGVPGVEQVFVSQEPRVFHWPRQRKGRPRVLQVPTTDKEEEEEEEEERREELHSFGGDIGNYTSRVRRDKVKRRLGILPLFLGRRKAASTSTRTSVPTSAPRPREEATENFLPKLFLPWRKRRPPPPILIPPVIFVSSPEETEAVLAMDARRHHASRRASEMYNVDPEEDLDFPSEESYPGMYQDRFFSEPFEEGWTTVGEVTLAMDRRSPDPRTDRASSPSRLSASPPPATRSPNKRLQLNIASTNTASANASSGKEPRQDTQSTKKAEGSWRSPFSSPKKSQESRLARAAVESSPKKSPKNSPKNSPKKVKGVATFSSPQCGRRVLPEILESSVQQYRPVYNTPPLDNTNLVPKPYCSRYSASLTSPPYRGPVASPRTILPKPGATPRTESNGGEAAAVTQRQPKDTKGKIKRSMPSPEERLEGCGKTSRTSSPRSLSPTSPTSPITQPGMDSIYSRPLTRSPLTTGKTSKSPINNKTPSPIASPLGSPVTSSGLSPTTSPSLSPTPSPKFSPVTTPPPSKRGQSPPFLQPLSPPSSPDNKESLSDSTDLDPEEFLALSTLDSALLDTPSLYSCSNKPFNSYEELQTMTEKEQKSSVSAPTPTTTAAARPSNQTKTSEYSGDVDSGGSRHPSEAMDTTLSRDSLNTTISDEMKSLRSFVAQEELSTPPASQGPKSQREESLEFVFEEVTDSPCHLPREHVPAPAKSPAGGSLATGEKKPSRLSPKLGKFTQKVSDKNKENEEKSKSSPFLPRNILHFGTKDKKAKAKAHETDSPKTEGWTSEAIEEYLLETSREESVKLGLLTEEDITYHESKGRHQTSSASRPLPEVTVSDELQPVAPFRRRTAPSPPQSRSPSWNPQDIENYLLEHNKDENLRLGLLSKEDIDIYEWKRATGMSPICDTSWTRETLRKNKVVHSSESSLSGSASQPASPDPCAAAPRLTAPAMSPRAKTHAPREPRKPGGEKPVDVPSQPISVPRRRVRAPAPPIGTPPSAKSAVAASAASDNSKLNAHFAFRGFKLGQGLNSSGPGRKGCAPQPPAVASLQQEAVKPPAPKHDSLKESIPDTITARDAKQGGLRSRFTKPKLTTPGFTRISSPSPAPATSEHRAATTAPGVTKSEARNSEVIVQAAPEAARVSSPAVAKPHARPKRLPLEKIGVKLPGMTAPKAPQTPPEMEVETVSVESVSPIGSPTRARKTGADERPARRRTPYSRLTRFLRKEPNSSPNTPPTETPAHALFLRESPRGVGSSAVSDEDEGGVRKKLNDMRLRLSWLRRRGDSQGSVRPMPEEVQGWAESFHNLMASKYGQALFKAFLQREFSEENVEFWLAVEDFKKTRAAKMPSKASKIHSDYVAVQAPKEINLDPGTRAQIAKSLDCPDKYIFDAAQKRVQALMESDAYLRFLQSELYKELLHPDSSLSNPEAL